MGREVRRVHKDWVHPKDDNGRYRPLLDESFRAAVEEWDEGNRQWQAGEHRWQSEPWVSPNWTWVDMEGDRPSDPGDYMPEWTDEERTHLQMYEDTTEGTPISPVMETPEELARWLVDHEASSFGHRTASYESWLQVARGGFAPSLVVIGGVTQSGVEALENEEAKP